MKNYLLTISTILLFVASCSSPEKEAPPNDLNFVHTVFFWLNDTVTIQEKADFEKGLLDLGKVASIGRFEYGKPAGTPREVVDNSYDYAWIVYFEDKAGHDSYQEDPIHLEFIEKYNHLWENVRVFDTLLQE